MYALCVCLCVCVPGPQMLETLVERLYKGALNLRVRRQQETEEKKDLLANRDLVRYVIHTPLWRGRSSRLGYAPDGRNFSRVWRFNSSVFMSL